MREALETRERERRSAGASIRSGPVAIGTYPVGPDALPFLGWRSSLGDEDWVGLGGADDADYFQRVLTDTGVDLRSG